jgi:hypothetical protein
MVILSQETFADQLIPPAPAEVTAPTPAALPLEAMQQPAPAAVAELGRAGDVLPATAGERRPRTETSGWTKGVIRGDIQLAVSVLNRLQSISIVVEEARSAIGQDNRFHRTNKLIVPVTLGVGTPTFEVTDVPFSDYPYRVMVQAPGLNGSWRHVNIDQHQPLVDDVVLTITPGTPFSLLVRDQDTAPYPKLDIVMQPIGEPLGRAWQKGTTDNFGSIVFEDVLAGDYSLQVTENGQSLLEPRTITVQPGTRGHNAAVIGQSQSLLIPRGIPVRVQVHDPAGYGIADAKVVATNKDRIKLHEVPLVSDAGGFADFAQLQVGSWHIVVEKDGFHRIDFTLTLKAGQDPVNKQVKLIRAY